MGLNKDLADARASWAPLSFYEKFEHACILIVTALIALIVVLAIWNLLLKILLSLLASTLDPTDPSVFQALFGMIFTVIIALEFKRSLLVLAERVDSVVQVRAVLLIALLAVAATACTRRRRLGARRRILDGSRPGPPPHRCEGSGESGVGYQKRHPNDTPVDPTLVPGCHAPPEPELFRRWQAADDGQLCVNGRLLLARGRKSVDGRCCVLRPDRQVPSDQREQDWDTVKRASDQLGRAKRQELQRPESKNYLWGNGRKLNTCPDWAVASGVNRLSVHRANVAGALPGSTP